MEPRDALAGLLDAARDMLRYGEHDGPCDNGPDRLESCTLHVAALQRRQERLEVALRLVENLGPVPENQPDPLPDQRSGP